MKILSLKAQGIGWLRDEVSIPIEELGDAAVVAVTGLNGAGKTSLFELILALLDGSTPSHGAVAAMACDKNAYIEAVIETDQPYRLRRTIDATLRKPKVDAYIWDKDGNPIGDSDGKQTTFAVERGKRFPSKAVYLASGFTSQERDGQFLKIPKTERKALFVEMLQLEYLQKLSKEAGERAKVLEARLVELRAKIDVLQENADRKAELKIDCKFAKDDLGDAVKKREQAEKDAAESRKKIEAWSEKSHRLEREVDEATVALRDAQSHKDQLEEKIAEANKTIAEIVGRGDLVEASLLAVSDGGRDLVSAREAREKVEAEITVTYAALEAWQKESTMLGQGTVEAAAKSRDSHYITDQVSIELRRINKDLTKGSESRTSLQARLAKRESLQGTIEKAKGVDEKISKAEAETSDLRKKDDDFRRSEKSWRKQHDEAKEALRVCLDSYKETVDAANADLLDAKGALTALTTVAAGLGEAWCAGEGEYAQCKLIATATEASKGLEAARGRVFEAETSLSAARTDKSDGKAARAALDAIGDSPEAPDMSSIDRLDDELSALRETQSASVDARARLGALDDAQKQDDALDAEASNLMAELKNTESLLSKAQANFDRDEVANLDAIKSYGTHRSKKPVQVDDATIQELREAETECTAALATAREALATAERDAKSAETTKSELSEQVDKWNGEFLTATNARGATKTALETIESAKDSHNSDKPLPVSEIDLHSLRHLETEATAKLARFKESLAIAEKAAVQAKEMKADVTAIVADVDDWRHLQKAFGLDGIQSLEVDAAGPEVSSLINELLQSCYGSRFVVQLETTIPLADGKGGTKEIFDLHVIDSEKGWEGSASHLSGGERVFVDEAISLAVAIFNTRRSSIPILDIFRDETAGALDYEKAPLYVTMLRKAIEVGGFRRIYFIAHLRELWALADAVIKVVDGQCMVAEAVS